MRESDVDEAAINENLSVVQRRELETNSRPAAASNEQ